MSEDMEKNIPGCMETDGTGTENVYADFDIDSYLADYKSLLTEKEELSVQIEEKDAQMLRLQADFDNFRRRSRENNEEAMRHATSALLMNLLPVLDNFDHALAAMQENTDRQGVEMIARQFMQVLQGEGVEEIPALGAEFDPKLHQAVGQLEAAEAERGKVILVLQKGYTVNGRLLRAAMVQVGC